MYHTHTNYCKLRKSMHSQVTKKTTKEKINSESVIFPLLRNVVVIVKNGNTQLPKGTHGIVLVVGSLKKRQGVYFF